MCFMDLNILFTTLNILTPTSDISSITINCKCSYRHVSLFNKFDDKFNKLDKDLRIVGQVCSMLNVLLSRQY
jgi:hypothetical protein